MALGTNHYLKADLQNLIPEVWGSKINDTYKRALKLAPLFINRSADLANGGDRVHVNGLANFTANTKVPQTQVTLQKPAISQVDLVVDQHIESSFVIEDKEAAQIGYYDLDMLANNAAYAIVKKVDDAVAVALASLSTNTVNVGTAGNQFGTVDPILAALAVLGENEINVDRVEDLRFIMNPTTYFTRVQKLDRFVSRDYTTDTDSVSKVASYSLMGIPVILTTAVTGAQGYLVHKDTIHWATSPLGRNSEGAMVGANGIRVQSNYEQPWLATLTTADTLYGVAINRQEGAVKFITTP